MTEQEFSTQKLITLLDQIRGAIVRKELSEDYQEQIWNSITWNKHEPENKDMLKYLFTGWYVLGGPSLISNDDELRSESNRAVLSGNTQNYPDSTSNITE